MKTEVTTEVTLKIKKEYFKAVIYKGRPKSSVPKSYKEVGYAGHDMCGLVAQRHLTMYRNSRGGLVYKVYIDGCFHPFYGKLEILEKLN